MEDVLAVYALPYDPLYPVVCMDESSKQLIGEVHDPIPAAPGRPARVDHEYVRNGVAQIFIEVEPLAGRRHVAVTERRTAEDWAVWIRGMLDERYPDAVKVLLVLDNLNTHTAASLYQTFEPQEARRLAERLELHYTPKHGSWLNVAEIELSVLQRQCLDQLHQLRIKLRSHGSLLLQVRWFPLGSRKDEPLAQGGKHGFFGRLLSTGVFRTGTLCTPRSPPGRATATTGRRRSTGSSQPRMHASS